MASAEQLKALLKSHLDRDDERFCSVAMQIAAHEAKLGHGNVAQGLRNLIDESKTRRGLASAEAISRSPDGLATLLESSYPKTRLNEMVLRKEISEQIQRIIREQRQSTQLLEHGLHPRCKLLLIGPSGTGKTLTASVLAGELRLPLLQVRLDGVITRFMGETAAKLRQIFNAIGRIRGVYLFDEFDALGSQRGLANDVGEIRRILNSFLLMIEQENSHSIIIAATNYPLILDPALFRRFDDVLHYDLPDESHIAELLKARLAGRATKSINWDRLGSRAVGLSHAEIARAANEVLKDALVHERTQVNESHICEMLDERLRIARRLSDPDN